MRGYLAIAVIFLFVAASNAQVPDVTAELGFSLSRDVEIRSLPIPKYPNDAKKAGWGGKIDVTVTLDDDGNVISADKADGPYPMCPSVTDPMVLSLRNAALESARKAKFKILSTEKPREGILTYTFNAEAPMAIGGIGGEPTGVRVLKIAEKADSSSADSSLPTIVSGAVLKGTAMDLGKPTYPAAARAVHAGGTISVQVIIAESGSVFSAIAISGHPLLRRTSEIAACNSRFTPTLLQGKPVKVSGILTYNFVP